MHATYIYSIYNQKKKYMIHYVFINYVQGIYSARLKNDNLIKFSAGLKIKHLPVKAIFFTKLTNVGK